MPHAKHRLTGTPVYTKWRNLRSVKTRGSATRVTRRWTASDGQSFNRFLDDVGPIPGPGWQLRRLEGTHTFCASYAFWRPYHEPSSGHKRGLTNPHDWQLDDWPYQLTLDPREDFLPTGPSPERAAREDRDDLIYRWPTHPNGLWWQPGDDDLFDDEGDLTDITLTITRAIARAQGLMD
jgi:hypothetical protein